MNPQLNKEDFDRIYDIGLIQIYSKKKQNYPSVKPILQEVIELFEINDLTDISVTPRLDYNPYIEVIKDLIYSALPKDYLWNGIFRIEQQEITNYVYHGSSMYNNAYRYEMFVKTKIDQLNSLPSDWVYNNHSLVTEFMNDDNELYKNLLKIKNRFPITLKEQ